ncbi:Prefoldin subunit-domain-containing protein [Achaetomium macrosporum]|uniref:Prefoldin subunit-domain-containing protein n=1 Tax=Achaetomium macrosporum TaxID=79813 RepID=A0AAN7H8E5_9PEZI|nr:Prefoldin subunit-domain-containing protein [Achaetomium macrosporum]
MAQPKDHLSDLDRHVQLLEGKVNQLRASLAHWQQWYLEYSSLKEEVEQLPRDPPPHEQLRRIRRDFETKLLTKKELNEILGKNDLKEPEQIAGVLSRRMDYVEQNIGSLRKLLEKEENRLAAASVVAAPDAGTDEESGLPITDIVEELDEDGNVVNFRLQRGADTQPKVVEALKKLGIDEKDLPETEADGRDNHGASTPSSKPDGSKEGLGPDAPAAPSGSPEGAHGDEPTSVKKSVSFAADTKPGHENMEPPESRAAQELERLMQKARDQEAMDMSSAVIPENESPEDSQLRREMLEYSMSEIGPVVAELQLEEHSGDGDSDDMTWDGTDGEFDEETDDDSEDELGRSKRSFITPDYIKRMQELEKRLNVQSAFTVGRSDSKPKKADEDIGRVALVGDPSTAAAPPSTAPREKKTVAFSSKLDIAPDPTPQQPVEGKPKARKVAEVGDIMEKVAEEKSLEEPAERPKRVSRFKKDRADKDRVISSPTSAAPLPPGPHQVPASFFPARAAPPPDPTPPEHQTLASEVVERPVGADPIEPDEMDDVLLYKEAAVEYNRLRNQLIQKQGGVAQQNGALDSETGLVPLDEELGGPKRVSRFKAGRLTKLQ